jgi:hypothetical protein
MQIIKRYLKKKNVSQVKKKDLLFFLIYKYIFFPLINFILKKEL